MRVRALALRILQQLRGDRRTLALMMFAPLLMLSMLYLILSDSNVEPTVAIINVPLSYADNLERYSIRTLRCSNFSQAYQLLNEEKVSAIVFMESNKLRAEIDGTSPAKAAKIVSGLELAKLINNSYRLDLVTDINYIYGYDDMSSFDQYGAVLIGFITFFFVFLISGISFLRERTTGTLEKLLSTPIRRWEIVLGYVLGFGTVTIVQSLIISWFCIQILGVICAGPILWIICITFLTAINALTLGILLSTLANNEFQMVQFIPLVVIPQICFSGLFDFSDSSPWLQSFSYIMPLKYVADALRSIMIKGQGIEAIWLDIVVLLLFSLFFMTLNIAALKRHRSL